MTLNFVWMLWQQMELQTQEMSVIRNVAKSLDLDMDEIEKMREKVTKPVN